MKNVETQKVNFISIIRGIVLFVLITLSLIHVYFDNSPNVTENNKNYKLLIQARDSIENILLEKLDKGEIATKEYVITLKSNESYYKKEISKCNKEKRLIIKEFSFNGRKSFHYWLFIFGLTLSFFTLSVRYAYHIINNYKNRYLKKSLIFEASAWLAVSLFWVVHSVVARTKDFPSLTYLIVKLIVCLIIGFTIFYFIRYLVNRKTHTVESYRNSIIKLISLISDIRLNHYFHMAAKAQNENNKKVIEKDVEIVDEKIFSTLEKVADES